MRIAEAISSRPWAPSCAGFCHGEFGPGDAFFRDALSITAERFHFLLAEGSRFSGTLGLAI